MLDPAICRPDSPVGSWMRFTWELFDGITNPALVLPLLLTLILIPWLVRSWPWKRFTSGAGLVLLLLYGVVASPLAIHVSNWLLVRPLPEDAGQPAEAIVVLGRGSELQADRVQVAAQLWQAKRAPRIFVSGVYDAPLMAKALADRGVTPSAIDGEPCSRTTEQNAQFTAALLQPQGVHQIVLVTDPPHMLRSVLTFRSFGFEVIPHPNPFPSHYQARKQAFLIVREYAGLITYGLLGRFAPRPAPPVESVAWVESQSVSFLHLSVQKGEVLNQLV